ncbi:ribosomal protein S18 acetylase RimI-like enzyme [Variovorax sp. TBS-050B]|uniref:GNAT family N-acetyltransferase n=1 Tax=Variovorax sp. TBS-050B TaxID=2940551 RepID=UPI002474E39C|nr:GNAT family N-acetyltransferase [Variovorax sp. TBS-050B]MDH6590355.1 ribosomal protein S18 acetylase RimI-like enzyme [Variovorax sp. TBS-050B]
MSLSIEPLAEAHFDALRAVLDTVAREKRYLAFTQAPPREQAFAFYGQILARGDCLRVALWQGRVVGWCDVLPVHGEARAHVGTLGIGLLPAFRGRSIGEPLMRAAIAGAWARGITRIELTVRTDNTRAKALYERLGFQTEGLMRHAMRIDGVGLDNWAMALLRDQPASATASTSSLSP